MDGLRQLHASEGLRGMWRGTSISMVRSAAVTGERGVLRHSLSEVLLLV